MNTLRLDNVEGELDYMVDELPLWSWIALVTGEERFAEKRSTTPFVLQIPKRRQRVHYEMLVGKKPGDVEGGRVPLYVCECCADYGCGVTSIILTLNPETVVWSEFAPFTPDKALPNAPDLIFDRRDYVSALAAVA
jgi:hypothetical protein